MKVRCAVLDEKVKKQHDRSVPLVPGREVQMVEVHVVLDVWLDQVHLQRQKHEKLSRVWKQLYGQLS